MISSEHNTSNEVTLCPIEDEEEEEEEEDEDEEEGPNPTPPDTRPPIVPLPFTKLLLFTPRLLLLPGP